MKGLLYVVFLMLVAMNAFCETNIINNILTELGWKYLKESAVAKEGSEPISFRTYVKVFEHKGRKGDDQSYEAKILFSKDENIFWLGRSYYEKFAISNDNIFGFKCFDGIECVVSSSSSKKDNFLDKFNDLVMKLEKDKSNITKRYSIIKIFGRPIFSEKHSAMIPLAPEIASITATKGNISIVFNGQNDVVAGITLDSNLNVIDSKIMKYYEEHPEELNKEQKADPVAEQSQTDSVAENTIGNSKETQTETYEQYTEELTKKQEIGGAGSLYDYHNKYVV